MAISETVVARGSVLRCLNTGFVGRRCLRTSYGISQTEDFIPGQHNNSQKVEDEHENKTVVHNCIRWLLKYVAALRGIEIGIV